MSSKQSMPMKQEQLILLIQQFFLNFDLKDRLFQNLEFLTIKVRLFLQMLV